ncbi:DinB family protein [Larkinella soli]|uniref:DinB family protein n=1 Tax=Larkinella soli TaxID=1770527 RepID=UPI000FFB6FE5|nr:DinB family protein [Larkinella soli]
MKKPQPAEYPHSRYFSNYIDLVDSENVIETLRRQLVTVEELFENLSSEQQNFRYAEGKWSPKEMLGHMIDTERIFAYRALCIARGERQSLPGFDENEYFAHSNFDSQALNHLLNHYRYVRLSTIALAESLPEEAHTRVGTANGNPVSARAIFSILAGHEKHHLNVLAERYKL